MLWHHYYQLHLSQAGIFSLLRAVRLVMTLLWTLVWLACSFLMRKRRGTFIVQDHGHELGQQQLVNAAAVLRDLGLTMTRV
jgi:hypothetical protein